jgi:flagellar biosynthesis/type III secretory pathway protein FliH
MEHSTLEEVLGVEREIRDQLDAERQQASQWLEATRRELDQAHAAELESIRREGEAAEAAAKAAADAGAAAALERLTQQVERAQARGDAELRLHVRDCLVALLPEADRAR